MFFKLLKKNKVKYHFTVGVNKTDDIPFSIYHFSTVKPYILNTSKEFTKSRILHFLIMHIISFLIK